MGVFDYMINFYKNIRKKRNKLSKNFLRDEFRCKCGCGQAIINKDLVTMMQRARDIIGMPIVPHCVNRCPEHNAKYYEFGASKKSTHLRGAGMDWHVRGWSMEKLHTFVKENHGPDKLFYGGAKCYDWGVHTDVGKFRTW